MNIPVLAFRNLLRNPKRAALKVAGIAVITAVMIIWGSFGRGFSELLRHNAVALELGDLQVHHRNYLASDGVYDFLDQPVDFPAFERLGLAAAPRLYSYALAAAGEQSAGILARGVTLGREEQVTSVHRHIGQGQWLSADDAKGVVVGAQLAKILNLKVGDDLVVIGQALDGSLASDRFTVRGILRLANQNIDRRSVYMAEEAFRGFFLMTAGFHEIAFRQLNIGQALAADVENVAALFPGAAVKTWRERNPVLARMLEVQGLTIYFTLAFIYLALGGLILNSMLMTIFDRMKEFGVMKAIGMSPVRVFALIVSETLWLAVFAAGVSLIVGLALAYYFQAHGLSLSFLVDRFSFAGMTLEPILYGVVGLKQALAPVIFLLAMMPLAAFYPAWKAAVVKPIEALSGQ